ncbi:DMT family transporter [Vibrio maerlii]|uniref:DMT family transporter n=1 Tax=Vibrio maerlii TaxID=2231648 RepID=UPI000E3DD7D3|nr:DMT family transporter [Vibrio maerlii]
MRGETLLLITSLLAGIGWVAAKVVVESMPGELFIATRFLIAGLAILPLCIRELSTHSVVQIAKVAAIGLLMSVAMQVWIYAISITNTLAEGGFIVSLAMIISPFTAWVMFKKKPNKAFWLALPIAVIGLMLMTLTSGWQLEESQVVFLFSSILFSIHFVLNKQITNSVKPVAAMCVQMIAIGISGLVWSKVLGISAEQVTFSQIFVFWFFISTLVATAFRFILQTVGQSKVNVETASLIMILEPIWTLILSGVILGEVLATQKLFGGLLIVLSLVVYIKKTSTIKPAVTRVSPQVNCS